MKLEPKTTTILQNLEKQKRAHAQAKQQGTFSPNFPDPHKYLAEERWQDQTETPTETPTPTQFVNRPLTPEEKARMKKMTDP